MKVHHGQTIAGPDDTPYRERVQKAGHEPNLTLPGIPYGVPSKANPVTKANPGLGGTTLSHPFKAGKPKI